MPEEITEITVTDVTLMKPQEDTAFAQKSAIILKDIVNQNKWSIKLGGTSEHLKYEAWQTIGKYYGYTVKTGEANYIEYGDIRGFEAKAWVIDNKTGIEIGGAEAACLSDEANWKNKPLFQLKSMAQTRAGSKALRQILGFVVALAGYNPTPAEEIADVEKNEELDKWPGATQKTSTQNQDGCICGTTNQYHSLKCPMRK